MRRPVLISAILAISLIVLVFGYGALVASSYPAGPWGMMGQQMMGVPGEWTDPASRIMHYVLYAFLVAVPVFGIALLFARGHSLPPFGFWEIPSPWTADKALARNLEEVHEPISSSSWRCFT